MSWSLGDNALGYWPCDKLHSDRILDLSGNDETMLSSTHLNRAYRALALVDTPLGGFPKAVDYSGNRHTETAGAILPAGSGDWTVACWVYLNNYDQHNYIWSQGNGGGTDRTIMAASNTGVGNHVRFFNEDVNVNGNTLVPLLTWSHLAARCVAGVVTIYLNGAVIGSVSGLTGVEQTRFVWGAYGNDGNNQCDAYITGKIVTADVTTPIVEFMAGPPAPESNHIQVAFDNAIIGGKVDFSRAAETVDALGQARAINEPRYSQARGFADPVEWTAGHVFNNSSQTRILASGTGADGRGLTVVRDHIDDELYVVTGDSATVTATRDIAGDDMMDGASTPNTYYTRGGGCIHMGAIVSLCERRVSGQPQGISLVWSQDDFATREVIDLPSNTAAAGADFGLPRTQNYAMHGVYKDPDYPLSLRAWLPFTDYLSSQGGNVDSGGQMGLALLHRASAADAWQLSARICHDDWVDDATAGHHFHGAGLIWPDSTRNAKLCLFVGDTDKHNRAGVYDITLDDDWLTNAVSLDLEHGRFDKDGTIIYPSPQPTNIMPGPTPDCLLVSGDETAQVIGKYGPVHANSIEVKDVIWKHTRNTVGSSLEGPAPIHAAHVPGVGYVHGGGQDQYHMLSNDGLLWASFNRPGSARVFQHGGKMMLLLGDTLYTADRPTVRSYRPLQLNAGLENELSPATGCTEQSFTKPADNYLVPVYYDAGAGQFKYRETNATYGHVADAAIPVQPEELPPVDLTQDLMILEGRCDEQDYRQGAWRLNYNAPDHDITAPGVLKMHVCNVSDIQQSSKFRCILRTGGGAEDGAIAWDVTGWQQWTPITQRLTSGSAGYAYLEVYMGGDNSLTFDNRQLVVVEGYYAGDTQVGYPIAPRSQGSDERLTIPADANLGNFAARLVYRVPMDATDSVETRCVALIYADANNYIRITQEQETANQAGSPDPPPITNVAVEVFVGGTSVGSAEIEGSAWLGDTMDIGVSVVGTALTLSGRVGDDEFVSATAFLTDVPTAPITELRHRDTDDAVFAHEVLGWSVKGGDIDVADIGERNTLAIRPPDKHELIVG